MTPTKGAKPVSDANPKRNAAERVILTRLNNARRYLSESKSANMMSEWESRIKLYQTQLVKAEARAKLRG